MQAGWNRGSGSSAPQQDRRTAAGSQVNCSARRWDIWAQQAASGKRPCFASEHRFTCMEADCPWRNECLGLRAEWHR
jgi:hypothetical protein